MISDAGSTIILDSDGKWPFPLTLDKAQLALDAIEQIKAWVFKVECDATARGRF